MGIPEIKQSQVDTLISMATTWGGMFTQAVPEEAKDGKENYEAAMEELRDTEQLVILGLIKESTDKYNQKVATLYAMTDHQWRVFEITDVGRAMFTATTKGIQ